MAEITGLRPDQYKHTFDAIFPQHRHADHGSAWIAERVQGDLVFGVRQHVRNLLHLSRKDGAACNGAPSRRSGAIFQELLKLGRHVGALDRAVIVGCAFPHANRPAMRFAEMNRRSEERRENRIEIESRATDDFQHVRGRSLHLQRFGQVSRARLHLLEQPRVLDGDDSLIGEGLDKIDFGVGERLFGPARDDQRPDAAFARQHRRIEHRHATRLPEDRLEMFRHVGLFGEIGELDGASLRYRLARRASRERQRINAPMALAFEPPSRHAFGDVAVDQIYRGAVGIEETLAGVRGSSRIRAPRLRWTC